MECFARCFFWIFVVIVSAHAQAPTEALAQRILTLTLQSRYTEAAHTADSLSKFEPGRGAFFRNMVALSRFDDLGDTNDLMRTRQALEKASWREPFWENLRLFQLGYVKSEQRETMSAGFTMRKAAKGFAQIPTLEARAFYALYAYYLEGATAWLPFASDQRKHFLSTLDSAAHGNSYYWPLFATSLTWMLFDRQEYAQALKLVDFALKKAPQHPVYLQMRADMLFRLKRYPEAAALYEHSAAQYAQRSPRSIRWWCAIGNLLRIYAAQHDSARVQACQLKFQSAAFAPMRKWMPPSLLSDLEDKKLLPE